MIRKIALFAFALLALGIFNLNQNIQTDTQLKVATVDVSSASGILESLVATSAFAGSGDECPTGTKKCPDNTLCCKKGTQCYGPNMTGTGKHICSSKPPVKPKK